ncbi:MAG TPA: hypothetical protein VHM28_04695 [Anaerolineales bacterium]|jgi:hypothetical protein|nr:hypothetical protein [Anaerolineales bacterium]
MKYSIDVPEYSSAEGLKFEWKANFHISIRIDNERTVLIAANSDGLKSLARHLLALAEAPVPKGYHFHLDDSNSLEEGSCELVIMRE